MVGKEWLVDASGCDDGLLAQRRCILEICDGIIRDLDLHVIGEPSVNQFPRGGMTVFYLLTESHLACHTYPECGVATFNLYCCRERAEWPWHDELVHALLAKSVTVTVVTRGTGSTAEAAGGK